MKIVTANPSIPILTLLIIGAGVQAAESPRAANTVVLDETGVQNLRIQTISVEERTFERTVFAIGSVEEIPASQYSLSSRIPGLAKEINAFIGDGVKKGQTLVVVESRQPGDPPPTVSLKALHDGIVTASHVLKGQPVEPNQDLLDISDRREVWVVARIPEQMAAGITIGTKARITFPALVGEPVESQLFRFGVKADRDAGTIDGIYRIANPDGKLQPGMRAEFTITVASRPNVLAVPEESVQGDPANRVVYVKDFDVPNAFIKSPVVLGEKGGGWVEVKSGLFPGDKVVTRGSYPLGFVGGGGISLKEALDAAHGHAHNEDGSEIAENPASDEGESHDGHVSSGSGGGNTNRFLQIYAGVTSLLVLVLAQLLLSMKRQVAGKGKDELKPESS